MVVFQQIILECWLNKVCLYKKFQRSLKLILPADVLLTIYNSLIFPHFNYCHLARGSKIIAGHKLHLLQKKAVRIVDHRHFLAHTLMYNILLSYFEHNYETCPACCMQLLWNL